MKKLILVLLMAVSSAASFSQDTSSLHKYEVTSNDGSYYVCHPYKCVPLVTTSKYKPYISVGSSLSSSTFSNGVELGIYNDNAWFALGASQYSIDQQFYWTGQFKTYLKLKSYNIVDLFAYNSVNVSIDHYKNLGFEPGLVTVFNISKKWAPQFSLTAPVYENTNFHFSTLSAGISLNYWIK